MQPFMIAYSPISTWLITLVWAALPVKVQTNSGQVIEGDLQRFKNESVVLSQGGSTVEIMYDDIATLTPEEAEVQTPPKYRVTLIGGSKIQAQAVRVTDSDLVVEPRRQNPVRIPLRQVKAIRFRPPSNNTDAAWFGNLEKESRGDSLVIRRPGDVLDSQQGVVVSIDSDAVKFDIEGTVVNAPIDRLEGLIFGGSNSAVDSADIQVMDVYGSQWTALAIAPSEGEQPLQVMLTESLKHEIPLYQVASVRWSGGVSFLAEMEPASEKLQTYFETNVDSKLLDSFFGIRPTDEQNLTMFGGSDAEYRIEPGYRLAAGAVEHDSENGGGEVTVRLKLDGKVVWEESIAPSQPRGFELPLKEARRLSIEVDSSKDGDLGDRVKLIRPRLLK
ncbi:MAG: hypothetical protein AAGG48_28400 [Planctomycetota bacterium]